jgi:hypothetical protein
MYSTVYEPSIKISSITLNDKTIIMDKHNCHYEVSIIVALRIVQISKVVIEDNSIQRYSVGLKFNDIDAIELSGAFSGIMSLRYKGNIDLNRLGYNLDYENFKLEIDYMDVETEQYIRFSSCFDSNFNDSHRKYCFDISEEVIEFISNDDYNFIRYNASVEVESFDENNVFESELDQQSTSSSYAEGLYDPESDEFNTAKKEYTVVPMEQLKIKKEIVISDSEIQISKEEIDLNQDVPELFTDNEMNIGIK